MELPRWIVDYNTVDRLPRGERLLSDLMPAPHDELLVFSQPSRLLLSGPLSIRCCNPLHPLEKNKANGPLEKNKGNGPQL